MTGNDKAREAAVRWTADRARPIDETPDGLEPLRAHARDARVVGLGTATRGAHELFTLQHRVLRSLVEDHGYRALALEEDWTSGLALDAYVRTGQGDPRDLLAQAWLPWQTQEVLDAIVWLRSFNEHHPDDPVQIIGLDAATTRAAAYDAVTEFVRRAAPERSAELAEHYAPLRPYGDIDEHVSRYRELPDKQPLIEHAERAHDLVASLPDGHEGLRDDEGHSAALQHARIIVTFHRFHEKPVMEVLPYIERRMAETLLWWLDRTGGKAVYWGGIGHTGVGETAVSGTATRTNTGGLLRRWLGAGYVSAGLTFDHGAVHGGVPVPSPPAGFTDSVLSEAYPAGQFLLDLRTAPLPDWFTSPGRTRVIGPGYDPADDADHHLAGGSFADWFDVIVHTREATPARHIFG